MHKGSARNKNIGWAHKREKEKNVEPLTTTPKSWAGGEIRNTARKSERWSQQNKTNKRGVRHVCSSGVAGGEKKPRSRQALGEVQQVEGARVQRFGNAKGQKKA